MSWVLREFRAAGRVWPLVIEAVAHRRFPSLEAVMETVALRCLVLQNDPQKLRRHTLFHWWSRGQAMT